MVRGEGDPALFSADFQKVLFPDRIKQLQGPLGSQGPIKNFELLSDEIADGNKLRRYRATFEGGMRVRILFTIDAQGKLAGTGVRPEDIRNDPGALSRGQPLDPYHRHPEVPRKSRMDLF